MGEIMSCVKDSLERAIDLLKKSVGHFFIEEEDEDLSSRIHYAMNTLVQNEKKIWLRTKVGREILGDFGASSEKLLDVVNKLQKADKIGPDFLVEVDVALRKVESHAKRLNEETRRRSMVVT